jgi:hypothetical protein
MFKYYNIMEVRRKWKASFGSVNDVLLLSGSKAIEVEIKTKRSLKIFLVIVVFRQGHTFSL